MSLWVGGCLGVLEPGLHAHKTPATAPTNTATRLRCLLGLDGEVQMLAQHCPPRLLRTGPDPSPCLLGRLELREGPWGRVTGGSPPPPRSPHRPNPVGHSR